MRYFHCFSNTLPDSCQILRLFLREAVLYLLYISEGNDNTIKNDYSREYITMWPCYQYLPTLAALIFAVSSPGLALLDSSNVLVKFSSLRRSSWLAFFLVCSHPDSGPLLFPNPGSKSHPCSFKQSTEQQLWLPSLRFQGVS